MADYVYGVKKFKNVADMMVINVSSPNTPGLRERASQRQHERARARARETEGEGEGCGGVGGVEWSPLTDRERARERARARERWWCRRYGGGSFDTFLGFSLLWSILRDSPR